MRSLSYRHAIEYLIAGAIELIIMGHHEIPILKHGASLQTHELVS